MVLEAGDHLWEKLDASLELHYHFIIPHSSRDFPPSINLFSTLLSQEKNETRGGEKFSICNFYMNLRERIT
jgi:hypothetical protein